MPRKKSVKIILIILAVCIVLAAVAAAFLFGGKWQNQGEQSSGIYFRQNNVTVEKYETCTLELLGAEGKEIEWKSSNEEIATVQDGVVCGWKKGNTQILAFVDGTEVSCDVMVLDNQYVPVIELGERDELTMDIGGVYGLNPVLYYNGNAYTDVEYTYSSTSNAAKVAQTGVITAAEAGEALVCVQAKWRNNTVEATVAVHVIDASTSIEVSGKVFDIYFNGRGEEYPSSVDIGISIFDKGIPVQEKDASVAYTELIMEGDTAGAAIIKNGTAYAEEIGTIHFIAEYISAEGTIVRTTSFAVNVHQTPYDKYMMPIEGEEYAFFIEPRNDRNSVEWDEQLGAFHLKNKNVELDDGRAFLFNREYIENIIRYTNAKSIVFEVKADGIHSGADNNDEIIFQGFYPEWFNDSEYQRFDNTSQWTEVEIFFDDIPLDQDGNRKAIMLLSTVEGMYVRNIRPMTEGLFLTMDVEITTLGGKWNQDIELGFFPHSYEGSIGNCTNRAAVKAGVKTTVKFRLNDFLQGGKVPGFGVVVFGGPEWDDKLSDGVTPDRHTLTISNLRVTGEQRYSLDLSTALCTTGKDNTGFTDANGSGVASIVDGAIVITNGFRFDGHKITLGAVDPKEKTYICLDMLFTTLGNSSDPVEIGFYPYNFEGDIGGFTDKISVTAGTASTVKLDMEKYLVDGGIPGIGFVILGGPEWNSTLEDGITYDRHTLTVSGVELVGKQSAVYDLSRSQWAGGQNGTGYTNANGFGQAAIGSSIVITDGIRFDGHKITLAEEPDTYICLDMLFTTLGNSTEPVEIGFYPHNFEGDINDFTDKISVTAGTTTTVKLELGKYLVDGELPGIGFAIFGGPTWDAKLADGTTPDRHTITISNMRLEGALEQTFDLSSAAVASGNNGTGYTNANGSGQAAIADGMIVISDGFRYDGHKITFTDEELPEVTEPEVTEPEVTEPEVTDPVVTEPPVEEPDAYISLDMLITTLGNSAEDIEIGFYPYNFAGDINYYTDKLAIKAGTTSNVQLELSKYLVDGELPGIGFTVLGGPEWNTTLPNGSPDKHTLTISGVKLVGEQSTVYDLSQSKWANGNNGTGYTNANGFGQAAIGSSIVITDGVRFDGHKITLVKAPDTYISLDVLITTLGNSAEDIEIGFYPYNFAGDINNYTDKVAIKAGTTSNVLLDLSKYLVDGELTGIGFTVLGGPEWNTTLEDGSPDKHTLTVSNVKLVGKQSEVYDLNASTWTNGTNAGYTNANGFGQAAIGSSIVISGGIRYDGHKITLVEEPDTYICLDMLITTLGNSTEPVDVGFYPYNFEGDINNHVDRVAITAGTTTTVKLDLRKYLVDGELTGIGFAIFGGPTWDAKLEDGTTPDRHTLTISSVKLVGEQSAIYDLSQSQWANGNNGTGYTNANGSGTAVIGESIVITNGFCYDGHKITLVEDTNTYICMDILFTTLSDSTEDLDVRFFPHNFAGDFHGEYTDNVVITAGTKKTVRLKVDEYLIDGELPGIGFGVFGGPEWNTQMEDGTYDRHSVIISNIHMEGPEAEAIELSAVATGLSNSNNGGTATIVDGTVVITNGFRYDGHKITF